MIKALRKKSIKLNQWSYLTILTTFVSNEKVKEFKEKRKY